MKDVHFILIGYISQISDTMSSAGVVFIFISTYVPVREGPLPDYISWKMDEGMNEDMCTNKFRMRFEGTWYHIKCGRCHLSSWYLAPCGNRVHIAEMEVLIRTCVSSLVRNSMSGQTVREKEKTRHMDCITDCRSLLVMNWHDSWRLSTISDHKGPRLSIGRSPFDHGDHDPVRLDSTHTLEAVNV